MQIKIKKFKYKIKHKNHQIDRIIIILNKNIFKYLKNFEFLKFYKLKDFIFSIWDVFDKNVKSIKKKQLRKTMKNTEIHCSM